MTDTAAALADIRGELNDQFYERREAIEAILMAALTRQHVFVLGPPGTAKSQLMREVVSRFTGATYFEQLLSKNRPDSAVLGPYDLPLLRDKGEFRRKDAGYLTSVNFAFLDEVGKASPTLGHDLLAALNERIKHQVNGERSAVPIPLHTCFTASNELPAAESEDEAALWDRLLLRCVVDYIQNDGMFRDLLERANGEVRKSTTITYEALCEATEAVEEVVILDDVLDAVLKIRSDLKKNGITIGDRRWRESMRVVRASAYLNGRSVATVEDLTALRFTLWEDLEQMKKIERTILAVASPDSEEAATLLDEVNELISSLNAKKGESDDKVFAYVPEALGKAQAIRKQANRLKAKLEAAKSSTIRIDEVLGHVETLVSEGKKLLRLED